MVVAALAGELAAAEAFPERPGKKTMVKICGGCHGLQLMAKMRKNRAGWQTSVEDMVTKGMQAEEQDMEEVVNYLAKYLTRLNVNKASAEELADVLGLPAKQASAVVEQRTKVGPFRDFDSLLKTPGVEAGRVTDQRDRISFSDQ